MKRGLILILVLVSLSFVVAEPCSPNVTLLNQDPYPAVPGDYVKLVFQVEELDNPECGDIKFELLEDYPLVFDPGETGVKKFKKVNYIQDYESSLLVPYEVRIDKDALDGTAPIKVQVRNEWDNALSRTFDIEVDDVRADFEVHVKDYDPILKELTFEVLNIEEADVEALTVEIPKQENIQIKGSNRVIVGDVDSNDYTTADFEAIPRDGEIKLLLHYSDSINVRRTIEKTVTYDSSYFVERANGQESTSAWAYAFWILLIINIVTWFIRRRRRKKKNGRK